MEKRKGDFINVPRHKDDPFYRYTMPALRVKVEGRGKMIKTVLLNLDDISNDLERPVEYLLKFIGLELGAQVEAKNNKYIIGGDRQVEELYKVFDTFIEKYILCVVCKNPETNLGTKKGNITLTCRACGKVTQVDYPHKLTDYIIKKERVQEKTASKKKPSITDSDDPSDVLREFWESKPSNSDIIFKVEEIQSQQGWTSDQMLRVVFASLYDKEILSDFERKADIFKLFMNSPKSQETALYCVEKLCTMEKSIVSSISSILEKFYEKKVLDKPTLQKWFEQPHPKIDKKLSQQIRGNHNVKVFVENLTDD